MSSIEVEKSSVSGLCKLSVLKDADTPMVAVDLDAVEFNIDTMMSKLAKYPGVSVRPHQKTAKSPLFANLLFQRGAKGICVAKVSEAEVFVDAGIHDILITTEITGRVKIARLMNLLEISPEIRIVADNVFVVRDLGDAWKEMGLKQPVKLLVDLNVGQERTGVNTTKDALALARVIVEQKGLDLIGIQGYEGHLQHLDADEREKKCRESMKKLLTVADALRKAGHNMSVVTTGGTGTAEICAACDGITEVQPGSFIFMDVAYREPTNHLYRNALSIIATVISKANSKRIVVDAGTKSLSIDMGNAEPRGKSDWTYRPAGDEYGIIESKESEIDLEPGDRIELIPGHIDTTVALHDHFHVVRGEELIGVWPIEARGKVQ